MRVGKGGRETSIDAPRLVRRAHAEQLNLPRDFAWARRQERLCPPYWRFQLIEIRIGRLARRGSPAYPGMAHPAMHCPELTWRDAF
jgi:hypothetical protein